MSLLEKREDRIKRIKGAAELDLLTFIKLVAPHRVLGAVHEELVRYWTSSDARPNQLCLLPRDHQKSQMAAFYAAWLLTKEPWTTILYVSATADLAEKQLYAIKNIVDSKIYKRFWPTMLDPDEGKREKWSAMEISVDHPRRKEEGVRDPTVKAAGLTTNITGFHANFIFLDDVVVPNNAYTEEGRKKVEMMYSQLSSIKTTGGKTVSVGTRYHPKDLYAIMQERMVERYEDGEIISKEPLYDIFQKVVEENGEFLWPKQMRSDGRSFGFDENELALKRAEYIDRTQFYSQYYNNPNNPENAKIPKENFQYYSRKQLNNEDGRWKINNNRLNIFAAVDFAFSLNKKADYSAIVVVGVDSDRRYYALDIARFKTQSIKEYFDQILGLYSKWGFRKLRAEVSVAQEVIVEDLKQNYIVPNGLALTVDKFRPTRAQGSKEERIMAILEPKYSNGQMFHYKGGYCQVLEEELELENPPHDDIIDALAAAIDVSIPPARTGFSRGQKKNRIKPNSRFGGYGVDLSRRVA